MLGLAAVDCAGRAVLGSDGDAGGTVEGEGDSWDGEGDSWGGDEEGDGVRGAPSWGVVGVEGVPNPTRT